MYEVVTHLLLPRLSTSMKINRLLLTLTVLGFLSPLAVGAQNFMYIETFLTQVGDLVERVIPILIALSLLVFIWGLVIFIRSSGDPDAKTRGRDKMVWGSIGLFIAVSIFGILTTLVTVFNIGDTSTGHIPPEVLK